VSGRSRRSELRVAGVRESRAMVLGKLSSITDFDQDLQVDCLGGQHYTTELSSPP